MANHDRPCRDRSRVKLVESSTTCGVDEREAVSTSANERVCRGFRAVVQLTTVIPSDLSSAMERMSELMPRLFGLHAQGGAAE
jgi:hypothetical protein